MGEEWGIRPLPCQLEQQLQQKQQQQQQCMPQIVAAPPVWPPCSAGLAIRCTGSSFAPGSAATPRTCGQDYLTGPLRHEQHCVRGLPAYSPYRPTTQPTTLQPAHPTCSPNSATQRSPPHSVACPVDNSNAPAPRVWWSTVPPKGQATAELCFFCFQVLIANLQSRPLPPFPLSADPLFKAPLFVTWLKRRCGENGAKKDQLELRGCIGCLDPIVLVPGLSEYVLRSSTQDRRFSPVRLEELPFLTCRLSILHKFEKCANIFDWQVGLHGVLVSFADSSERQYSATYLPEVAREHGMTHDVAIKELVAKAGYQGVCDEEFFSQLEVTRYQTLVESVTYPEFLNSSLNSSLVSALPQFETPEQQQSNSRGCCGPGLTH